MHRLIFSLLRLSAHHLALAASALQPLESGTLFLHLSIPVPVLIPFVVTSRPTTVSRPSNPLDASPLAPQIQLLLTIVCVYKLYLFTYLLTCSRSMYSTSFIRRHQRCGLRLPLLQQLVVTWWREKTVRVFFLFLPSSSPSSFSSSASSSSMTSVGSDVNP